MGRDEGGSLFDHFWWSEGGRRVSRMIVLGNLRHWGWLVGHRKDREERWGGKERFACGKRPAYYESSMLLSKTFSSRTVKIATLLEME